MKALCMCCDGYEEVSVVDAQPDSGEATLVDILARGFIRSPPALVQCISGPAAGQELLLPVSGWQSQKWVLDESLRGGLCTVWRAVSPP